MTAPSRVLLGEGAQLTSSDVGAWCAGMVWGSIPGGTGPGLQVRT